MAFNPDTRPTKPASTLTNKSVLRATPIFSAQRDSRLLLGALMRAFVYSSAGIGFLLATTFPLLQIFGIGSSFEPPTWLGVILLICVCIYGYFEVRSAFAGIHKPKSHK